MKWLEKLFRKPRSKPGQPNDMKITKKVALEVAVHEGLVRQAYKDVKGIWTWSVGITSMSGHNVERYIGKPASLEYCIEVWIWLLERYAEDVREQFTRPLTEEQFAAALSFHWNTGSIHKASWVDAFNAGEMEDAARRFMLWDKPKSIVGRRRAERDLFFKGVWSNNGTITEYTRVTSNHYPDWGSARKVKIDHIMGKLVDG